MASALPDRDGDKTYRAPRAALHISDFDILGRIGDGSFSTVILAKLRNQENQYAIKIVNKHLILRNKMAEYVRNERHILDQLNYDGIVKLLFTFQDPDSLYFGCEYCPGGDLYDQITQKGRLSLETTRFYTAEIVLILEYIRSKQVVHRDLKPENLLITADGHLKLTDFGSAKAFFLPPTGGLGKQARATSFVGTAEYVSPEVLSNAPLSYPADLWALGSLIFQMLTGKPPFKAGSEYLTFQKVAERDFEFPEDFPPQARDLVDALLQLEPEKRLGARDITDLKTHPFFDGIQWDTLRREIAPAFIPAPGPTLELEGLDWEITSLVRDNMVVPTAVPTHTVTTTMPNTDPQAQAASTEVATTGDGRSQTPTSVTGKEGALVGEVTADASGSARDRNCAHAGGGFSSRPHTDVVEDASRQAFAWAGPCAPSDGGVTYVRNPDAPSDSSDDDDDEPQGNDANERRATTCESVLQR